MPPADSQQVPQAPPAPQAPAAFQGWPGAPAAGNVSLHAGARPAGVYPQSALAYAFTGGTGAATVDIDGQAWREDVGTGASTPLGFIPALANAIGAVTAVSPDGSTVALAGVSGVNLYSTGSGARTAVLRADLTGGVIDGTGPTKMAISPDGRWLVADDTNGNAHLWNLATRQSYLLAVSAAGSAYGDAFAFTPDSRELAVSTGDGSVFLWDVATRELAATLINGPYSPASVVAIAFGEGGALLAVAGGGYVYVVDVATRSVVGTLRDLRDPHETPVLVAFSPDGRLLAAEFSTDGDTEVWSVATGESVGWLPGPESDSDVQVGFSPDSRRLVFAQIGDPGLRIFDVYAST